MTELILNSNTPALGNIGDIDFWCEETNDSFSKAIVVQEPPGSDFWSLQDMGQKAHNLKFKAWFIDKAPVTYRSSQDVFAILRRNINISLYHPRYGNFVGKIKSVDVKQTDEVNAVLFDIDFIVSSGNPSVIIFDNVQATVQTYYADGLGKAYPRFPVEPDNIFYPILAGIPDIVNDVTSKTILLSSTISAALSSFTGPIAKWISIVSNTVSYVESVVAAVDILPNSMLSTLNFALNLPGRVVGVFASIAGRYVASNQGIKGFPARFLQALSDNLSSLDAALYSFGNDPGGTRTTFLAVAALSMGLECANRFAEDQAARNANLQTVPATTWDVAGNQIGVSAPLPVMSQSDVEACLAITNTWAEAALTADRTNTAISAMVSALIKHVNVIKLTSDYIVSIDVQHPTHLFLVLLNNGLSIYDAGRVLAINDIPNPNFVQGKVNIYANP